MLRFADEDPAHVRPPPAFPRRMRITGTIRELVMEAVSGDPEDRPALKRQSRADGERVFDPLRHFVRPMREQAVITHADSQAERHPIQDKRNGDGLPVDKKERSDGASVKNNQKDDYRPIRLGAALAYRKNRLSRRCLSNQKGYRSDAINFKGLAL